MNNNTIKKGSEPSWPVFYDPRQRRGILLNYSVLVAGSILLCLALLWCWGFFAEPVLPAVALTPLPKLLPALGEEAARTVAPPDCRLLRPLPATARDTPERRLPDPVQGDRPLAFGFMVNWDEAAINSLQRHIDALDVLVPQWLYYATDDRMLIEDDPDSRERVVDLAHGAGGRLRIMPMVVNLNKGKWNVEAFASALASGKDRRYMVDQLGDYADVHDFFGISVDFEQLPDAAMPDFYAFIEELAVKLHNDDRKLSVNVPFESGTMDYARVAAAADYVIVMAYDEHWTGGEPGPIAGAPWLAGRVAAFQAAVPAGKLVLGIGNYALDWSGSGPAAVDSVEGALAKARQAGARVASDPVSLNPVFRYCDGGGNEHQVWFLDAVTAFNAASLFAPARPVGYAVWRLGMEDPSLWEFFGGDRVPDAETARRLARVVPQQVLYEGKGEVIRLSAKPEDGLRQVWLDPASGLIRSECFDVLPSSYMNTRYGGGEGRSIALTFDDGPDPAYTPAILSILQDNGIKATFFTVGMNGQMHPDLLRREAAEGHEIGIHTFTHPDIASLNPNSWRRNSRPARAAWKCFWVVTRSSSARPTGGISTPPTRGSSNPSSRSPTGVT